MKLLLIICVIYLSSCAGELPEDARAYSPMRVDSQLRGAWAGSACVHDLLNCYEMVKGDMVCAFHNYFASMCGVVKQTCDNLGGYFDAGSWFEIRESACRRMLAASRRTGG